VVGAESSDRDRDDRDADDRSEAYEVEIRKADGTEVDVKLDKDMQVIGQDADDNDGRDDGRDDDANEAPEADDRALSAGERSSAGDAATKAVGGGTATNVVACDDRGDAYEVDVRTADGTEWDVDLDSSFAVVHKSIDR
jgi:uncharacterized membrane protein YkoI